MGKGQHWADLHLIQSIRSNEHISRIADGMISMRKNESTTGSTMRVQVPRLIMPGSFISGIRDRMAD